MKKILGVILAVVFIFSMTHCGKKKTDYYYPQWYSVALKDKEAKDLTYLNWGEKLEISDPEGREKITLKVKQSGKMVDVVLLKTKRVLDGTQGYVLENEIMAKPLSLGVILKETVLYSAPTMTAGSKNPVKTATPVFVLAKKGGEKDPKEEKWYKIKCYNAPAAYQLKEDTAIWGEKWIKADDLSLNEKDVNMIVAMQVSLKNFRRAKAAAEANKNEKTEKNLNDAATSEKAALENLISSNIDSEAVKYLKQAIEMISGNDMKPVEPKKQEEMKPLFENNQDLQKNNESGTRVNEGS